ncbi:hypothetical protein GCM10017559_60190 [Streptosporangium longisporum]|uniref:Uncharacterized protein n=1 Tax=Streptosporangium longisporum TaxID=46187 RepID=A0ABP6KZA8_9ACTN
MRVTVAVEGSEVTAGPVGGVPVAVAVLTTVPASTSAWVMTRVPLQVVEACGARVVVGQVIAAGVFEPLETSVILTPVRVVLPVLTTA